MGTLIVGIVARRALVLFVSALGSVNAGAEMYKYENEDGVTVLDSHVPPRYVENGYTVLSDDGRVLKVVPRKLTAEERREQERQRQAEEAREQAERDRIARDRTLMRLYSKPEDVARARDSRLASIESTLQTSNANLSRLRERKKTFEAELADIERAGGQISQARLDRIEKVEARIEQVKQEIQDKKQEMENTRQAFNADLQRVKALYDENPDEFADGRSEDGAS